MKSHAGKILKTMYLDELNVDEYRLSQGTGIPPQTIRWIIDGTAEFTPEISKKINEFLGYEDDPYFWVNLQKTCNMPIIENAPENEIQELRQSKNLVEAILCPA